MSDEQFRQDIQAIHQQIAVVYSTLRLAPVQQKQVAEALQEIAAALDHLQLLYEEMQTSLEASDVVEEELFLQNQQAMQEREYYYDLFQCGPDAYAITDANGIILEANGALARLLNAPQSQLTSYPLAACVADADYQKFRTLMSQLSSASDDVQHWEMSLCPRQGKPFAALLKVAIARDNFGAIEALQIGVHDINQYKQVVTQRAERLTWEDLQTQVTTPLTSLPPALDGLQVLLVDDEADAREFISAVLESQGVRVIAVATAAAALEALEKFRPNVLISDIRMPNEDGYSLIRKVQELEAKKGWHIPAAALTAYLGEDRSKALSAGFESHLHKLAQPAELIEMVAQLAGRATTSKSATRQTD